jgi:inhibitor of cysteine peptidase
MIVTPAQNGSTIQVKPGEPIEVHLPENPTTGHKWTPTETGPVALVGDDYEKTSSTIGGGGVRKFKFVAHGDGIVKLIHKRPWEDQGVGDFTLNVEIT